MADLNAGLYLSTNAMSAVAEADLSASAKATADPPKHCEGGQVRLNARDYRPDWAYMVNRGTSIADSRLMSDPRTLPVSELGPDERRGDARTGISPQDPGSMPRAEDDDETLERSPEFHDTPAPPRSDER